MWRKKRKVLILARESVKSSPIGKGKCKIITNFSSTMMTKLPSVCSSVSLSLSVSHLTHLAHNIGSASALPIIIIILITNIFRNKNRDLEVTRGQTPPENICISQSANQKYSFSTAERFVLCGLQIFEGSVFASSNLMHNLFYLFFFPIVFGIYLIQFFDWKNDLGQGSHTFNHAREVKRFFNLL